MARIYTSTLGARRLEAPLLQHTTRNPDFSLVYPSPNGGESQCSRARKKMVSVDYAVLRVSGLSVSGNIHKAYTSDRAGVAKHCYSTPPSC